MKNQKAKVKIGLQIAAQMRKLNLKKFHVSAFAEISRTQLDKILHGSNDYTLETLLKVLNTVDLEIELKSIWLIKDKSPEPAKRAVKKKKPPPEKVKEVSWP